LAGALLDFGFPVPTCSRSATDRTAPKHSSLSSSQHPDDHLVSCHRGSSRLSSPAPCFWHHCIWRFCLISLQGLALQPDPPSHQPHCPVRMFCLVPSSDRGTCPSSLFSSSCCFGRKKYIPDDTRLVPNFLIGRESNPTRPPSCSSCSSCSHRINRRLSGDFPIPSQAPDFLPGIRSPTTPLSFHLSPCIITTFL
jgi:hypothetical protein